MFLSSSGALPVVEQHGGRSTNPYTGSRCSTPITLASRLASGRQLTEPTVPHLPPQAAVHDSGALPVVVLLSPHADGGQVTEPSVSRSPSQAMVLASGAIPDVDFGELGTNPTGSRCSIPAPGASLANGGQLMELIVPHNPSQAVRFAGQSLHCFDPIANPFPLWDKVSLTDKQADDICESDLITRIESARLFVRKLAPGWFPDSPIPARSHD